jgi:hypothetical protein
MNFDGLLSAFYKYVMPAFIGVTLVASLLLLAGHHYTQATWVMVLVVINIVGYKSGMRTVVKDNDLLKMPEKVKT